MRFRPCIDLHDGTVKQIVGATLGAENAGLRTNFSSTLPPAHFAALYRRDNLTGGHIIMLGPGNESAALDALAACCAEFLVHAVDVEGTCTGVDARLLDLLAETIPIPTTYAGGVASAADLELIRAAGRGRIDVTVGSALDLFGGSGLRYRDLVSCCGPT